MRNSKKAKKEKKGRKEKKETTLNEKLSFLITNAFLIFFVLTVVGLIVFTYHLLYKSDYFFIKGRNNVVWVKEPLAKEPYEKFADIGVGQNIFKFDISSAAKEVLTDHPELYSVGIIRNFPNMLTLKIEPRLPVAQIGEKKFFLIDEEGMILTKAENSIREGLPIITGMGWRVFRRVGQKSSSSRMVTVLSLLKTMKETNFLNNHTLTKIDASNYRNLSFFIKDGLEVKIGYKDFEERLESLDRILASIAIDRDDIKYIDLRFDDAVLGTK